ncbi:MULTISPECIES: GNAT family N-acetyltransferase [Hyphomicrobiales]|jgi:ribosomal protein S18 acetylase RimI-like enzyme|uniref:GNAT family N-acetyltransferase n=1 Tax=Hyphomicrobiales TaxID=356 RepID=UPI000369D628|nr:MULTISPECIES: GNAT family N-acetyltransferase [Phyllobacteriaceae]MCX8568832.1 GNAT family N-acetyltransferase [Aminobacter sp. MET-1]
MRIIDGTATHLDAAASIWARATAARDGDDKPATLEEARPVIARVLGPGALLLIAETASGRAAAFAAIAPIPGEPDTAELHYLGVDPDHWGDGAGRELLSALTERLDGRCFREVRLSVYADNQRAVRLYERMGWHASGTPVPNLRTGRLEQRYALSLV